MEKPHGTDYDQPFLTVSEIARVFGISDQAVRFYHKKGLLVPDVRDTNTYRRYSWNKLSVLAQICFLRKAGVSIEDIKAYMQLDNLKDVRAYMGKLVKKLQDNEAEIHRAISILKRKCSYLDTLQSESISEHARLVTLPLRRYIHLGNDELTSANNDYFFKYPLIVVYNADENMVVRKIGIGAYLNTSPSPANAKDIRILPQQLCIACNFKGSYDAVYARIAELYRKYEDLPLSRICYAINVVDHLIENNQNNYIVNIQIPLLDECSDGSSEE